MHHSYQKTSETWHPHVYANPPKKPTPFSIRDILQPQKEDLEETKNHLEEEKSVQLAQSSLLSLLGANRLNIPIGQVL